MKKTTSIIIEIKDETDQYLILNFKRLSSNTFEVIYEEEDKDHICWGCDCEDESEKE